MYTKTKYPKIATITTDTPFFRNYDVIQRLVKDGYKDVYNDV